MKFYKLEINRKRRFIEAGSGNDWESLVCPTDAGHQRAGRRVSELSVDVLSWNVVDFSRTMLSEIVISDHALGIISQAGLRGFEIRPTRFESLPTGVIAANVPKLWEFVVRGEGGRAHRDSGISQIETCATCGLIRYSGFENGIVVDESNYDGSDFFTVLEYPRYVLASNRARTVLEEARLTNVDFIESSKLVWPSSVVMPKS